MVGPLPQQFLGQKYEHKNGKTFAVAYRCSSQQGRCDSSVKGKLHISGSKGLAVKLELAKAA